MEVQTAWQGLLPLYLFLGGLGGSTLALAAWLDVLAPKGTAELSDLAHGPPCCF